MTFAEAQDILDRAGRGENIPWREAHEAGEVWEAGRFAEEHASRSRDTLVRMYGYSQCDSVDLRGLRWDLRTEQPLTFKHLPAEPLPLIMVTDALNPGPVPRHFKADRYGPSGGHRLTCADNKGVVTLQHVVMSGLVECKLFTKGTLYRCMLTFERGLIVKTDAVPPERATNELGTGHAPGQSESVDKGTGEAGPATG